MNDDQDYLFVLMIASQTIGVIDAIPSQLLSVLQRLRINLRSTKGAGFLLEVKMTGWFCRRCHCWPLEPRP